MSLTLGPDLLYKKKGERKYSPSQLWTVLPHAVLHIARCRVRVTRKRSQQSSQRAVFDVLVKLAPDCQYAAAGCITEKESLCRATDSQRTATSRRT